MEKSYELIILRIKEEIDYIDNLLCQFNCAICMESFKIPLTLNCGHTFCEDCLIQYNTNICSICRQEIIFENINTNIILTKLFQELANKRSELVDHY